MYGELAAWFHLVTAPADYADEAAEIVRLLADHGVPLGPTNPAATVLELGSRPRTPRSTSRLGPT